MNEQGVRRTGCPDIMYPHVVLFPVWKEGEGEGMDGLTMWDLSEANSRMNTSPGTILNKL